MDKILVFIPLYNSASQITRVIDQFDQRVKKWVSKVIIVNNRSTDDSESKAIGHLKKNPSCIPFEVLRNDQNYGLGGSHKVAWEYAIDNGFDYVITLHGDDQGSIEDLLPSLENGDYKKYDCILGSRFCKGAQLKGYSKFRTFGNRTYNILFSIATGLKIEDLGAGLNLYNVNMLKDRHYIKFSDNLTFNYYGVLALKYYNQKFLFVPITWREADQVSNVKLFSQASNTLQFLMKFIINKKSFMEHEHRLNIITDYKTKVIFSTCGGNTL